MNEALHQLLVQQLNQSPSPLLWLADENLSAAELNAIRPRPELLAFTNRYDVHQSLVGIGIEAQLKDFDFSALPTEHFQTIVYRVSKERALVHHCINSAFRLLASDGQLILLGGKQDGLKTNAKNAARVFGSKEQIKKHGIHYLAVIRKAANQPQDRLDSNDYPELRLCEAGKLRFLSKPGIFGWNKEDRGSQLLLDETRGLLSAPPRPLEEISVLDLGCGYGYLLLATQDLPFASRTASDNNAAAVEAARANFAAAQLEATVTLDDCGAHLQQKFDLILCNPPFHHGFSASRELTHKFLSSIQRLLNEQGLALLVVNQFIPLEAVAAEYFGDVRLMGSNDSFKVIALSGAKRHRHTINAGGKK